MEPTIIVGANHPQFYTTVQASTREQDIFSCLLLPNYTRTWLYYYGNFNNLSEIHSSIFFSLSTPVKLLCTVISVSDKNIFWPKTFHSFGFLPCISSTQTISLINMATISFSKTV